ncbi:hypothetical protein EVAR_44975_1 [Eumeta japonica]|uniref:Uncharacterized protein n=1 Tax=Eumeta variegata TaxID=151549 RepID=A0A4C1W2L8_EUMVA|nr:hypothetical protein EVAR_44975_1 [Eumeta japonica]
MGRAGVCVPARGALSRPRGDNVSNDVQQINDSIVLTRCWRSNRTAPSPSALPRLRTLHPAHRPPALLRASPSHRYILGFVSDHRLIIRWIFNLGRVEGFASSHGYRIKFSVKDVFTASVTTVVSTLQFTQ